MPCWLSAEGLWPSTPAWLLVVNEPPDRNTQQDDTYNFEQHTNEIRLAHSRAHKGRTSRVSVSFLDPGDFLVVLPLSQPRRNAPPDNSKAVSGLMP